MLKLFRLRGGIKPEKTKGEVVSLVNEERRVFGLPILSPNRFLELAAFNHAKDMSKQGYFSHVTPDGADYIDRIRTAKYLDLSSSECGCTTLFNMKAIFDKNRTETTPNSITSSSEICGCKPRFSVGENIAKGQLTAGQAMNDWMNSKGHRANILHPQFVEIGIGLFGQLWVQNFGRVIIERITN